MSGEEDSPFHGSLNAWDRDNDPLSFLIVTEPIHGTLGLHSDGTYVYTPDKKFKGADVIRYKVNDGRIDSRVATILLKIESAADRRNTGLAKRSLREDGTHFVPWWWEKKEKVLSRSYTQEGKVFWRKKKTTVTRRLKSKGKKYNIILKPLGSLFEQLFSVNLRNREKQGSSTPPKTTSPTDGRKET